MTDHELDRHIVAALTRWGRAPSYVIGNCLCLAGHGRHPSRKILTRLRALEKRGEVACLGFTGNNYEWAIARERSDA